MNSTPSSLALSSSYIHFLVRSSYLKQLSYRLLKANGEADSIDELYLDFVLPGYNKFELMKSGQNKAVNGDNLSQYIDLVTHWTMIEV